MSWRVGRLGLLCSSELLVHGGTREDRALLSQLRHRSVAADLVAWDDPELLAGSYRALLLRSCWDYHSRLTEFLGTLRRFERRGITVWNVVDLVAWNSDKRYLRDLSADGIDIVPTVFLEAGARIGLDTLTQELGTADWVVKPAVGATASGLWRANSGEREKILDRLEACLESGAWLVQPFVPEIAREGEWSLVFVAGELCHGVLKTAAAGEYRVQKDFGGSVGFRVPPREAAVAASETLRALPAEPLYARVDLVISSGRVLLMELELIEPELFLTKGSRGLERMANEVARRFAELRPLVT